MKKIIITLSVCCMLTSAFGQMERKVSTYLSAQFNQTIYDITARNNPWGIGMGLESHLNTKSRFNPAIEITAHSYFAGYKDLFLVEGRDVTVSGVINVFAGANYHAGSATYLSLLIGPSFVNGNACFGMKPSVDFYFSKNKRWKGSVAYINIFNREPSVDKDFGSLNFSVGLKLF